MDFLLKVLLLNPNIEVGKESEIKGGFCFGWNCKFHILWNRTGNNFEDSPYQRNHSKYVIQYL